MNNKQFPSGLVILVKKDYWGIVFFIISILISVVLTNIISPSALQYFGIVEYSAYAFILRIVLCFGITIFFGAISSRLQPVLFRDSEFRMRFDQIILFEDYLIGEIRTKGGSTEEKLKFTDIVHFIQDVNDDVSLTLKDDFSPNGLIIVDYNRKQDYKMSRKLTKLQKKELVQFLNDQIKKHSEIKQV